MFNFINFNYLTPVLLIPAYFVVFEFDFLLTGRLVLKDNLLFNIMVKSNIIGI